MKWGRQRSAFGRGFGGVHRLAYVALVASVGAAALAEATPGDLDPSFSKDGKAYLLGDFSEDLAVQPDGRVVVVGNGSSSSGMIARIGPTGVLDKGFAKKGYVAKAFGSISGFPTAVAIQPDGKIVVAGTVDRPVSPFEADVALARFLPDGAADPSFAGDGVATLSTADAGKEESAEDVAIQPDGKVVVAGTATGLGIVARFNADGTPDNSFSGDGFMSSSFGFSAASLSAVGLGPTGSAYAAGVAFNGPSQPRDFLVVKIDAAGVPDPGFDTDGIRAVDIGTDDGASTIAVQADGSIVAGGFTKSGSAFPRLAPTGALDPGFGGDGIAGVAALDAVTGLGLAGDGSIYATGGESGILTLRLTRRRRRRRRGARSEGQVPGPVRAEATRRLSDGEAQDHGRRAPGCLPRPDHGQLPRHRPRLDPRTALPVLRQSDRIRTQAGRQQEGRQDERIDRLAAR